MKKIILLAITLGLLSFGAMAQEKKAPEHDMSSMQSGGAKKPLSPRGATSITLGGKKVTVDYGRPSARSRKIVGGLVPFDQVWRTGANEATSFVTETDVTINGTKVPAGSYTLYTLPSAGTWKLIVNKQTGQWGTEYDEKQDLARIDLKKESTSAPVEQFTISLDKKSDHSATLKLEWENTRLLADVEI